MIVRVNLDEILTLIVALHMMPLRLPPCNQALMGNHRNTLNSGKDSA